MEIKKLLIANRGEIARRIIRTCRKRGIEVVAVYSDADQNLPYVKEADEAVRIGPPPVAQSYLNIDTIIRTAKEKKVDAIHPGYGLLSENATFARQVEEAGIRFIGPSSEVIALMGDKVKARQQMAAAGVPIVPGTPEGVKNVEEALIKAQEIGFPVMLKASAGGGGIGMIVCRSEDELSKAFPSTQGRAKAYFGDNTLFLEKYIEKPRHVEVQIVGDHKQNVVHLFERECSIQRRNQKVIEESLSPSISEKTRSRLYEAGVQAARAVGYTGVGTVEFLVDQDEQIYFLEMNTRLQVEHPVTEAITGLDLVELQLDLAAGKLLPFSQEQITATGHGIEYRIYAEDPTTFMPSPGKIEVFTAPQGEGIRIDAGVEAGNEVTPFYDPMIAKLVVHGKDREEALQRSREALSAFQIEGIRTNLPLLKEITTDPQFVSGKYDTHFLMNRTNSTRRN